MKIETERLILRKPQTSDWKSIYKILDGNSIKNLFATFPNSQKNTKNLIKKILKRWGKGFYEFVVQIKCTNEIIGIAGIRKIDKIDKKSHILSFIGKDYRKKGYATEAKISINDYCFNKLKLRKLKSEVAVFNKTSNQMQKKFGMVLEGVKRKENFNPYLKKFVDMNVYGLFKEEWQKVRPKLVKHLKEKIK